MQSSSIVKVWPQADGSAWVIEEHVDEAGDTHRRQYKAAQSVDRDAVLAARAIKLDEVLRRKETLFHLMHDRAPVFKLLTGAQFLARLRAIYQEGKAEHIARIATWLMNRLDAGDVTDLQLRTAFGLNTTQWNALKAKMQALRADWLAVESAEGE
jgi:hypothetical protein